MRSTVLNCEEQFSICCFNCYLHCRHRREVSLFTLYDEFEKLQNLIEPEMIFFRAEVLPTRRSAPTDPPRLTTTTTNLLSLNNEPEGPDQHRWLDREKVRCPPRAQWEDRYRLHRHRRQSDRLNSIHLRLPRLPNRPEKLLLLHRQQGELYRPEKLR